VANKVPAITHNMLLVQQVTDEDTEVVDLGMETNDVEELQQPAVGLQSVSHEDTANQLSTHHIMYANYQRQQSIKLQLDVWSQWPA